VRSNMLEIDRTCIFMRCTQTSLRPANMTHRNGELKEYIVSGTSKEQFTSRLIIALGGTPSPAVASSPSASSAPPSAAIQALLSDRAVKLEAHKKETEARERAKREAEARKRREELELAAANDPKVTAERKHALQVKKQQQQARDDRARILKRVEDDKAQRREKEAERKRLVAEQSRKHEQVEKPAVMHSSTSRSSTECALQVRLFDGSTIRSRFSASGSLTTDVRPWIQGKQGGDTPFTFKHVLTPLPNKTIETSEEEKSLRELGLTPNATLILVPVATYTSAYQPSGIVGSVASTGYGLVSSGFGAVSGLLGSVLGGGSAASPTEQPKQEPTSGGRTTSRPATKDIKKEERQYYNGNSVSLVHHSDTMSILTTTVDSL